MDLGLCGKAALVTGGSRGIGRQIALSLAEEGVDVAICARNPELLRQTEADLRALGVRALAMTANLFEAADCRRVVDEAAAAFGRLDILLNNASTNVSATLERGTDEQLMERILGKTLASMRCARAALPHMRRVGGGRIICMAGLSTRAVGDGSLPSALGNSSVTNFAKQLSHAVARDQILVNVVHPTFTRTDRAPGRFAARAEQRGITLEEAEASFAAEVPIGRIIEPADIAPLVVFLCSRQASAITGQAIAVDGGVLPAVFY